MFDLVAIIEHIGPSFAQGHYVSYILKKKRWYKWMTPWYAIQVMIIKYNYFKVYHMDLDEILQKQAYILIYQKKSVKVA